MGLAGSRPIVGPGSDENSGNSGSDGTGRLPPEARDGPKGVFLLPRLIAVEGGLAPIRDALRAAGYRVTDLEGRDLGCVDAVVTSGGDIDFLGEQERLTVAPVVCAAGLGADEVVAEVRRRAGSPDR